MRRTLLYLFASFVLAFLFLPSLIVIPFSVTDSIFLHFPPKGFTWVWYESYFGLPQRTSSSHTLIWVRHTIISVELAIAVVLVAVPMGLLAAYGLSRGRFWGRNVLGAIILSSLIVPIMITAIALFFFLSDSLPSILKPPVGLSVPVQGEYALIFLALVLGIVAIVLLLFRTFYRKPMDDWAPKLALWYQRFRPWAPIALLLTAAYLMLPWLYVWAYPSSSAWYDWWLFNPRDPYPPVPVPSVGLLLAHVVLAVPYVTIILSAALRNVDRNQDRAAAILGAGPKTTLTRVLLPQIKPGLAVAMIFSALVSFNEILMALFLSTGATETLQYQLWEGIRWAISPNIAAASTIILFFTILLLGTTLFTHRRSAPAKSRPALPPLRIAYPNFQGR